MPVTFPLFPVVFASSGALRRLVVGLPLAALITAALVAIMQGLIAQQPPTTTPERAPVPDIEIVSTRDVTPPGVRDWSTTLIELEPPPPIAARTVPEPGDAPGPAGRVPDLAPPTVTPAGPTTGFAQASLPPRLIFAPRLEYPAAMYPREGACTVGFDVEATGKTSNVSVVSCTQRGFANAAVRAARAFQYQPAQSAQGATVARGMRVELVFQIDE